MLEELFETIEYIRTKTSTRPDVGIILGTGLSELASHISQETSIAYSDIPNFPETRVQGHRGQLIFGVLGQHQVVAMQGRYHYFEGHSMQEITFPVRVMKQLGIKLLIVSNASGGLNADYEIGDLMIIRDHINLMPGNPLIGPNDDRLGTRFPDMSEAYDPSFIQSALNIANQQGIRVHTGVYAAVSGPTFETPAEYKYIRYIGADAVGMSTVPEVIVARHMGLPVFAVSVISDLGVEGRIVEISHEDVIDAASHSEPQLSSLVMELLITLNF